MRTKCASQSPCRASRLVVAASIVVAGAAAPACREESTGPSGEPGAAAVARPDSGDSVTSIVRTGPFAPLVAIEGRVVDQRTGDGVAGATVIVLRPGVSFEEWEASGGETTVSLMTGAARSDDAGAYRIEDLARGEEYTVMIVAPGYRPAIFESGLSILPGDSSPTRIEAVRLEPR